MRENASEKLDVPGKLHAGSFISNPLAAPWENAKRHSGWWLPGADEEKMSSFIRKNFELRASANGASVLLSPLFSQCLALLWLTIDLPSAEGPSKHLLHHQYQGHTKKVPHLRTNFAPAETAHHGLCPIASKNQLVEQRTKGSFCHSAELLPSGNLMAGQLQVRVVRVSSGALALTFHGGKPLSSAFGG